MIRCIFLVVSVAAASITTAQAEQTLRDIRFKPGATATEIRGEIRGSANRNYGVQTAAGQVMQILFKSSNGACYFNAYEPGAAEAAHIGSTSGNEFGRSPTKAGQHRLQVYMMRSAARRNETCRFTLSIELTGTPGSASAGVSDAQMRDGCTAEAARQYGVAASRIRLAALRSAPDGPFIDGAADKGAEGVKRLRCRFDAARKLRDVMALTPDGE
jgi:hypothetical protein